VAIGHQRQHAIRDKHRGGITTCTSTRRTYPYSHAPRVRVAEPRACGELELRLHRASATRVSGMFDWRVGILSGVCTSNQRIFGVDGIRCPAATLYREPKQRHRQCVHDRMSGHSLWLRIFHGGLPTGDVVIWGSHATSMWNRQYLLVLCGCRRRPDHCALSNGGTIFNPGVQIANSLICPIRRLPQFPRNQ